MSVRILIGDALTELRKLPDESVHMCCTSPPYFGLRDYGTAQWEGGDLGCDHLLGALVSQKSGLRNDGREHVGPYDGEKAVSTGMPYRDVCGRCGARRIDQQIGLEPSPDEFVAALVSVFREVRRVLRSDGVLFLNVGDSYASSSTYNAPRSMHSKGGWKQSGRGPNVYAPGGGLKPKDLIGIPWLLAFALRSDGWYLRQDIIWSKPNPMPESVTDRCTKSHEYLFLLAKSEQYHYDDGAVKETSVYGPGEGGHQRFGAPGGKAEVEYGSLVSGKVFNSDGTRNKRSVWTVATAPYSEAHFATFPPALIEPCIKTGCPVGGTVLDPFGGAGTTGLVADRLGRNAILIELNPAYAEMARRRIEGDAPLFTEVA